MAPSSCTATGPVGRGQQGLWADRDQSRNDAAVHSVELLAATASPYCGYPLAILAYNPNEAAPTTAVGQTIQLDLSNSTSLVSGLIYSGGTADFSPLTVDGGLIAWDVNVTNTASRITYNPTYGNAAPPPAFTMPSGRCRGADVPPDMGALHLLREPDGRSNPVQLDRQVGQWGSGGQPATAH